MAKFLGLLLAAPEVKPLLSSEHFSVDGTLLRAWASHSSLERADGTDDDPPPPSGGDGFGSVPAKGKKRAKGDFRGLLLSNQTHRSSSDGEARLFRKSNSTGAFLSYLLGQDSQRNPAALISAALAVFVLSPINVVRMPAPMPARLFALIPSLLPAPAAGIACI